MNDKELNELLTQIEENQKLTSAYLVEQSKLMEQNQVLYRASMGEQSLYLKQQRILIDALPHFSGTQKPENPSKCLYIVR